ncbi:MAG: LPS export ABC transporter periplasmic protein LptC [Gammaproteobacteria bacterium]|nr:LPS export ABC transporter periplasmic protein LptC [Gammaproteobacteria bacterium]
MSRTGIILFLFLVSIAIATSWLKRSATLEPQQIQGKIYTADSFMDSFQILQYNEIGELSYQLNGMRMEHYLEDRKSIIIKPEIFVQLENSPDYWQVNAEQAIALSREQDELTFTGNVVFKRPASSAAGSFSMHTDHLTIHPATEHMATTGTVTFADDNSIIVGENLEADIKQGLFTLHSVKGRYAQ